MDADGFIDVNEISIEKRRKVRKIIVPRRDIIEHFSNAGSKNEIIDGFFNFASVCFANLAVFSVFLREIQFLRGIGKNIKEGVYIGAYNIDMNTVIRRTIVSRLPYRGPIPVGVDEKQVFGKFFNHFADEVFLYPVCIRNNTADILFYGDTLQDEREACLATFEYIVDKTVLALRLLWIRQQLNTL